MLDFKHRLYLVTNEEACLGRDFFWVIEEALKGGVDLVQLREKTLTEYEFIDKAIRLNELCSQYNVPLIINDNINVAQQSNAFGLHLGQSDSAINQAKALLGDNFPIGLSVELQEHLQQAQVDHAWYLGVSPIFSTPTKTDTVAKWGLEGLRQIRRITNKPLVAIGNMNLNNVADVIKSGADCIAVVSQICAAENPAKVAELLRNEIEKTRHELY